MGYQSRLGKDGQGIQGEVQYEIRGKPQQRVHSPQLVGAEWKSRFLRCRVFDFKHEITLQTQVEYADFTFNISITFPSLFRNS